MKRSTRVLIAGFVIESLLMGIAIYLLIGINSGDLTPVTSQSDASITITSTIGMAMGVLAGVVAVVYVVLRRSEDKT